MSNVDVLYIGNDAILELRGLENDLTGQFLNAATVTATLTDATGTQIAGAAWPMTLAYVAASDGTYRATLPYTLALTPNEKVTAAISVDAGSGLRAFWALEFVARRRS